MKWLDLEFIASAWGDQQHKDIDEIGQHQFRLSHTDRLHKDHIISSI